jgi:F0F1-type ATP synthase membrane subunit b/b'
MVRDRQEYIKNTVEMAEGKLKDAENKNEMYQSELNKIEVYRREQRDKIDYELAKYRSMQIEKINEEIEDRKVWLSEQFETKRNDLLNAIAENVCNSVGDFMMDAFATITNSSLENSMLDKFFDEIGNLSSDLIDRINKNVGNSITFVSSFELNNSQKNVAEKTFKKRGIIHSNINFVVDRKIGMGNQIIVDNFVINSNLRNVVDQFRVRLEQIV